VLVELAAVPDTMLTGARDGEHWSFLPPFEICSMSTISSISDDTVLLYASGLDMLLEVIESRLSAEGATGSTAVRLGFVIPNSNE